MKKPTRSEYHGDSYKLYSDYNQLQLFVEDSDFENLYEEILHRSGILIRKVFSKTGKHSVVESAKSCKDPNCVFLIDRDWDDILDIEYDIDNLVVLEKHSIENYLIDYSGLRALVLADAPRGDINTLLSKECYDEIVSKVSDSLRPLFECFATMAICGTDTKNCSHKPGHFQMQNATCAPDEEQVMKFINQINLSFPENVSEYFAGDVLIDRGHGKYMLHYIWTGIRHKSGIGQLSMDKLMIRLAQVIDSTIFDSLCASIIDKTSRKSS